MPAFTLDASAEIFRQEDKLSAIESYLFMLTEQLRYTLSNLDRSNINSAAAEEFAISISRPIQAAVEDSINQLRSSLELTASSLTAKIEAADGRYSSLKQTVDSITFEVINAGSSSVISLAKDGVIVQSQTIALTGFVKFEDLAGIGTTMINGSNIRTGTIQGVTYYAAGLGESFVVTDHSYRWQIGGIRYNFVDADLLYADKMYLYTSAYFDGYSTWYPSVKIESAGNISVEAPGGLIYMKAGQYVTMSCGSELTIYIDNSPGTTTWQFIGGALYKNGVAVL